MSSETAEYSSEFRDFLQQVEAALIKSSAEARRLAEQTGTRFITRESLEQEKLEKQVSNNATVQRNVEQLK